jgi:hypothetical protein
VAAGAGLTLFGVATGLQPLLLLAGLAGGLVSQIYLPPMPPFKRAVLAAFAALVATWFAPAGASIAAAWLASLFDWWPRAVTAEVIQYPIALVLGVVSHRLPPLLFGWADRAEREGAR